MNRESWSAELDGDGRGAVLLLGVPSLYRSGERTELAPQRAAILAALFCNLAHGLDADGLKDWVWGEKSTVTGANVSRHVRILRQELDDSAVDATIETPSENAARRFRIVTPCAVDVDPFRTEADLASRAWSEGRVRPVRDHAANALSHWDGPRALVVASDMGAPLDQWARELESAYRRTLWLFARSTFLLGDWDEGTEALAAARTVAEHGLEEALCAAHVIGVERTLGKTEASKIIDRFGVDADVELDEESFPRLLASGRCVTEAEVALALAAFDADFGLGTPEIDLRGEPEPSGAAESDRSSTSEDPPSAASVTPPPRTALAVATDERVDAEIELRETESAPATTTVAGEVEALPASRPRQRWLAPLALLGLAVTLGVFAVLQIRGDGPLLDIDFSDAGEAARWTVSEQVVGAEYESGIATPPATAEIDSSRGESLRLVANPDALEARSHHLVLGRWLPGTAPAGRFTLAVSFFLPGSSASTTQIGPEVSVQVSQDGLTTEAAVQAVPNPWLNNLSIWSGGERWRPLEEGTYQPAIDQWVNLTLIFDTRTMSYESLTIGPAGETPTVYDLSTELLVSVDKATSDPSGESFADGIVVTLEAENLWSNEENPARARSEVYYDDLKLTVEE